VTHDEAFVLRVFQEGLARVLSDDEKQALVDGTYTMRRGDALERVRHQVAEELGRVLDGFKVED